MTGDQLERTHDRVEEARRLASPPCLAAWPADPPGPSYVGTRCARAEGHVDLGLHHGLRLAGRWLEWHA